MDLPIALFLGFIAMTLAIVVFGIIKRIPVLILSGGVFLIFWSVMTDNIIVDAFLDTNEPIAYSYNVESATGTNSYSNVNFGYVEFATSSSSQLVGDVIDCIDVYMSKTLVPTGTATIGTFSVTNTPIVTFGTQNVALLTTAFQWHTYCLPTGQTYTIKDQDRLGMSYLTGDATNLVNIRGDSNNPFDSTITVRQLYTTSWASTTSTDMDFRFYLRGSPDAIVNNPYPFTDIPKTLFSFFGIMIMVVSLVISKYDD